MGTASPRESGLRSPAMARSSARSGSLAGRWQKAHGVSGGAYCMGVGLTLGRALYPQPLPIRPLNTAHPPVQAESLRRTTSRSLGTPRPFPTQGLCHHQVRASSGLQLGGSQRVLRVTRPERHRSPRSSRAFDHRSFLRAHGPVDSGARGVESWAIHRVTGLHRAPSARSRSTGIDRRNHVFLRRVSLDCAILTQLPSNVPLWQCVSEN